MLEIRAYDQVDPLDVLRLNMTVLGFPLTPQLADAYRRHDRRVHDFFAFYAVVGGELAGQAGLFSSTVRTTAGPMRFGAVWAVCTLPQFGRQGIARTLMNWAEAQAAQLGCRAITLVTNRTRVAHRLYRNLGYLDLLPIRLAYGLHPPEPAVAAADHDLTVRPAAAGDLPQLEAAFFANAAGLVGFVARQPDFLQAAVQTELDPQQIHGVYRSGVPAGYVLAHRAGDFLHVRSAMLPPDISIIPVVDALRARYPAPYVRVEDVVRPEQVRNLTAHGYRLEDAWGTIMLKPLEPGLDVAALLDVGGRFYMDSLDFT